jgi:hypothetical protein
LTPEGWRALVADAVRRAQAGDPELVELIARVLSEQDEAKHRLRELGFGCIGMPWAEVVDAIDEALQRT